MSENPVNTYEMERYRQRVADPRSTQVDYELKLTQFDPRNYFQVRRRQSFAGENMIPRSAAARVCHLSTSKLAKSLRGGV